MSNMAMNPMDKIFFACLRLSATGYLNRYAETDSPVKVIDFQPRLGIQKWITSLMSSERLSAIAKMNSY